MALLKYGFKLHTGLYTDMNAIRRDETCDNIHSLYVDQWDWEKIILKEQRNKETLKELALNKQFKLPLNETFRDRLCTLFYLDLYLKLYNDIDANDNYSKFTDANGNVVEDPTVQDYFSTAYDSDFKTSIARDLGSTTQAFIDIERLSRERSDFKVYNATRGGKLEVFQRVDFDSIFNHLED